MTDDIVTEKIKYPIIATRGFTEEISVEQQAQIARLALEKISPETDFLIFDPEQQKEEYEDNGRSFHIPFNAPKKVYAKLDDYGSAEILSEQLGRKVGTQYILTLMLAEEY